MTKYEWESELRKNIHRLPDEEIRKVLEYYGELFADKAERGYGETEIVAQFGNPVDVADKILSEYEGELKPTEPVAVPPVSTPKPRESAPPASEPIQTPPTPSTSTKPSENEQTRTDEKRTVNRVSTQSGAVGLQADRLVLFVLLNVFTGFAFFIVAVVVWTVALSLTVAGGAMAIGGIAGTLVSIVQICIGNGLAGLAQTGVCIAVCGVGVIMLIAFILIIKLLVKATVKLFTALRDWICPREKNAEKSGVEV